MVKKFKVVASYPGSNLSKGTILTHEVCRTFSFEIGGRIWVINIHDIESFPHIFQELK
ncbi:hypothetical protein [Chryseobacterium artocarpi]|uniref:hypothetical protein n=1 Tax=Chryseobacterium artocarpi TaxID=1414727 RepID=UPI003F328188